jgi:hypothetical protein
MKDEQFKRDWAKCEASAKSASIGEKTELRFEIVLVECLEGRDIRPSLRLCGSLAAFHRLR